MQVVGMVRCRKRCNTGAGQGGQMRKSRGPGGSLEYRRKISLPMAWLLSYPTEFESEPTCLEFCSVQHCLIWPKACTDDQVAIWPAGSWRSRDSYLHCRCSPALMWETGCSPRRSRTNSSGAARLTSGFGELTSFQLSNWQIGFIV
jgi:hypothetical protein